jgi:hypothetical protein
MEPTPLRVHKIIVFLKAGIGPSVFPIYIAARLMGRPLGGGQATIVADTGS